MKNPKDRPGERQARLRRGEADQLIVEAIRSRWSGSRDQWVSGTAARKDVSALLAVIDGLLGTRGRDTNAE